MRTTISILRVLLLILPFFLAPIVSAKEIIATHEWQKVGPTDTVPTGLEIRMDLSGGGKWARLPPKEIEDGNTNIEAVPHKKRCGPSCMERQQERAEKRRAAGFLLREPRHNQRREQEIPIAEFNHPSLNSNSSMLQQAGILLVGVTIGVGVTTRFRRRSGLHEH